MGRQTFFEERTDQSEVKARIGDQPRPRQNPVGAHGAEGACGDGVRRAHGAGGSRLLQWQVLACEGTGILPCIPKTAWTSRGGSSPAMTSSSSAGVTKASSTKCKPALHRPDAMMICRQTVEHPFGTLKSWTGSAHFLTKTLEKVRTEMSLRVLAYNISSIFDNRQNALRIAADCQSQCPFAASERLQIVLRANRPDHSPRMPRRRPGNVHDARNAGGTLLRRPGKFPRKPLAPRPGLPRW